MSDPRYIIDLLARIVTVSLDKTLEVVKEDSAAILETIAIVDGLPPLEMLDTKRESTAT